MSGSPMTTDRPPVDEDGPAKDEHVEGRKQNMRHGTEERSVSSSSEMETQRRLSERNTATDPAAEASNSSSSEDDDELVEEDAGVDVGNENVELSVENETVHQQRRLLRDVDDSDSGDDDHKTNTSVLRKRPVASSQSNPRSHSTFQRSMEDTVPEGEGERPLSSGARDDDHAVDEGDDGAIPMDEIEGEEDPSSNSGNNNVDGGESFLVTVTCYLGSASAYWLPVLWLVAVCVEPGLLGMVYLVFFLWSSAFPEVCRRMGVVTHTKKRGLRNRILLSLGSCPSVRTLFLSLAISLCGVVLATVHTVWWCHNGGSHPHATTISPLASSSPPLHLLNHFARTQKEQEYVFFAGNSLTTNSGSSGSSAAGSSSDVGIVNSSSSSSGSFHRHDLHAAWPRAWSLLGFSMVCDSENDFGAHAWVHVVIAPVSFAAVLGMWLMRREEASRRFLVFPIELSPGGLVLEVMQVCGYGWSVWLVAVCCFLYRPAVIHAPLLAVFAFYTITSALAWHDESISPPQQQQQRDAAAAAAASSGAPLLAAVVSSSSTTTLVATKMAWHRPNVRRAAILYAMTMTWVYFGCLALIQQEGTAVFSPPLMKYLASIESDNGEAKIQFLWSAVLTFFVAMVHVVESEATRLSHLGYLHHLPGATEGVWAGRKLGLIYGSAHRLLFHAWYVTNAITLFFLVNTAPSALGVFWLLGWVYCLWGGGGVTTKMVIAVCAVAHMVGVYVADIKVYDPDFDRDNQDKDHPTVLVGVRPYQTRTSILAAWLLAITANNLIVLGYHRRLEAQKKNRTGRLRQTLQEQLPPPSSSNEDGRARVFSSERDNDDYHRQRRRTRGSLGYGSMTIAREHSSHAASYALVDHHAVEERWSEVASQRESLFNDDGDRNHHTDGGDVAHHLAATMPLPAGHHHHQKRSRLLVMSSSSARGVSFVKKAVDTTESLAVRAFSIFSELTRQYFFLVALFALFVAAVVRVNTLHIAFLVLFGMCLLRKEFSIFSWGLVVLYSVSVLITQYAVVAFVNVISPNMRQAGFTSSRSWEMWPYFLLAAIFLFQFRLYAISSIAELSATVRRYLELAERVTIGLIVWLNVLLFGVLACVSHATVIGASYFAFFFVSLIVLLETRSFHTPSRRMLYFWYLVVVCNIVNTVCCYAYQLYPEAVQKTLGYLSGDIAGISLEDLGIAGSNVVALWPKIASLLLCLVQARAWAARRHRHLLRRSGQRSGPHEYQDNNNNTTTPLLHMDVGLGFTRRLFINIMSAATTIAHLLALYSTPIAVICLFFGSVFGTTDADGQWGGQSSMMQLAYFVLGCMMTVSTHCLNSSTVWRVVQCLSGVATSAAFLLQLPMFPDRWISSLWPTFILVTVRCAATTTQWFVVFPHIFVFTTASMHAAFLKRDVFQRSSTAAAAAAASAASAASGGGGGVRRADIEVSISPILSDERQQQEEGPSQAQVTREGKDGANDGDGWRHMLFHPAQSMRFFSFHFTTMVLFVNACVRRNTFYGMLFFLIFCTTAFLGKTGMSRSYRWFLLQLLTFMITTLQFILHLRPVPDEQNSANYLRSWMADEQSMSMNIRVYFEMQPSTWNLLLTVSLWCAMSLHALALATHPCFVPLYGIQPTKGKDGKPVKEKLTVTERLKKSEAISLARRHNAVEFFKRLLPLPQGKRDFTRSTLWSDIALHVVYLRSPLVVLISMFLHALYDGTTDLSVFKVLSLLMVLAYLQNLHRLPWKGNGWWRYVVLFHGVWFFMRLLLFVPDIIQRRWFVCVCQVIGVMPHASLTSMNPSLLSDSASCPGTSYNQTEFALQATILVLVAAQYALYERSEYIFVLHQLHQQEVFAKCLGEAIRQTRHHALVQAKRSQRERINDMLTEMGAVQRERQRRVSMFHHHHRDRFSDDGGYASMMVSPTLKSQPRDASTPPPHVPTLSVGLSTAGAAAALVNEALPAPSMASPRVISREDTDTLIGSIAGVGGGGEHDSTSMEYMQLLERTLDKRSVELLANIETDQSRADLRRTVTLAASRMSQPKSGVMASPRLPGGTSAAEGGMSPLSPRAATRSRAPSARPSSLSAAPTSLVVDESIMTTVTSSTTPKRTSSFFSDLRLAHKTLVSWLDKFILWLDAHSVAAGVVRLDADHLKGRRFVSLITGIYRCAFSYTHYLSYFLYCLQFALAPCVLNVVLPVSVFGYAAMMNPRPHRGYWRFCLIYIQLIILVKCVVRMAHCEPNLLQTSSSRSSSTSSPTSGTAAPGVVYVSDVNSIFDASWLYARTCTSQYFLVDVLLDLGCVLVTVAHTAYLRAWGLWNDVELQATGDEYEAIPTEDEAAPPRGDGSAAPDTAASPPLGGGSGGGGGGLDGRNSFALTRPLPAYQGVHARHHQQHLGVAGNVLHTIRTILYNIRRNDVKIGTDVYRVGFACELLVILIMFFGYYNLVGSEDTLVNSLMSSLLPGSLAVMLLILFLCIVVDRIVYVRQVVLGNVVLNVLYSIFYHAVMIAWFMHQTTFVRTYLRDDSFGVHGSLGIAATLYLLKCGYLMCGATQISKGLKPYSTHIAFNGLYSSAEFIMYMISRLTPFVFDMRIILDWSVVPTSLKLPYWMKLEDVAHELYSLMCDKEDTRVALEMNKHDRNATYPAIFRYGIGWTLFAILGFILMFPLFLYSSFSPVLQQNWVDSCSCTLALEGSPPLWSSSSLVPLSASSSSSPYGTPSSALNPIPFQLNGTQRELLERVRPSLVSAGVSTDVVQQLPMTTYSNTLWAVSPPTLRDMLTALNASQAISLVLTVTIRNHASVDTASQISVLTMQHPLSPDTRRNLTALLTGQQNSTWLPNMYVPFLVNRQSGSASFTTYDGTTSTTTVGLTNTLDCNLISSGNISAAQQSFGATTYFSLKCRTIFRKSNAFPGPWILSKDEADCLGQDQCYNYEDISHNQSDFALASPTFVVESSPVLGASFLQSIGLIAAYTTFVLAIGRVLRFATTGSAYRTVFEDMDDPEHLLVLLEYIYLARATGEYALELDMYLEMMALIKVDEDRHAEVSKTMHQLRYGDRGGGLDDVRNIV